MHFFQEAGRDNGLHGNHTKHKKENPSSIVIPKGLGISTSLTNIVSNHRSDSDFNVGISDSNQNS